MQKETVLIYSTILIWTAEIKSVDRKPELVPHIVFAVTLCGVLATCPSRQVQSNWSYDSCVAHSILLIM
jgi:hypothetical protein